MNERVACGAWTRVSGEFRLAFSEQMRVVTVECEVRVPFLGCQTWRTAGKRPCLPIVPVCQQSPNREKRHRYFPAVVGTLQVNEPSLKPSGTQFWDSPREKERRTPAFPCLPISPVFRGCHRFPVPFSFRPGLSGLAWRSSLMAFFKDVVCDCGFESTTCALGIVNSDPYGLWEGGGPAPALRCPQCKRETARFKNSGF